MDMTALHVARMDLREVRAMAELFPFSHIFDIPAYPGVLPNALIDAGIPAFTPEIDAPRILNLEMIPLYVEGTMNVLKHYGVIDGPLGRTGRDSGLFVGNNTASPASEPFESARLPGCWRRSGDRLRCIRWRSPQPPKCGVRRFDRVGRHTVGMHHGRCARRRPWIARLVPKLSKRAIPCVGRRSTTGAVLALPSASCA